MFFKKDKLKRLKRIKIAGMRFKIQQINPIDLFDDKGDLKIPEIFKYTNRVSLAEHTAKFGTKEFKDAMTVMKPVIVAGLYEPKLDGNPFDYDDLFRDVEIGVKLYEKIIEHSLKKFKKKTSFLNRLLNTSTLGQPVLA